MLNLATKLFIYLTIFGNLRQLTWAQSHDYYTAGVVEFRPTIQGQTSAQMVEEHVQAYIDILQSAEANQTDIVVFPEGTLNNALQLTFVPAPEDNVIPCQLPATQSEQNVAYADFLVRLSCAARQVAKYVVINLTEKENCTANAAHDPRPCAANGLNIFNTNVVFDREGRVISRYRKVHVYVEPKNTTYVPEFAIFETDFGVRFGHFICFDMLFYTPAQELVVKYGLQDFIFPSMFYSELPFLTAVQLQQSWAWANNVNLLAAGASYPQSGCTGTGIYAGKRGALVAAMVGGTGIRQLYVATVPKTHNANARQVAAQRSNNHNIPQTDIRLLKDPQIEHFTSELLDFSTQSMTSRRLCMAEMCCQFDVAVAAAAKVTQSNANANTQSYKYRIGVFKGRRTYEKEEWSDLAICALYACTNESVASCGELFANDGVQVVAQHTFKAIQIVGNFKKVEQLLIMPNSLNTQLYSLQPEQVEWHVKDEGTAHNAKLSLTASSDNLLAFGIYANYYDTSASTQRGGSWGVLILMLAFWCAIIVADLMY